MKAELPAPLVPVEVDLRDFAFMPLEVSRLLRSRTWLKAKRRPEIGFYLVNLWAGAWHEVPAGSLPDDDDVLSDLARCTPARWRKLRGEILVAWVRCNDGRLYHPVVAEKAQEAWAHKLAQRQRTQAARDARRQRLHMPVAAAAAAPVAASKGEGQGQGERKGQGEEEAAASAPDVDQAFALWNRAAAREGWPEVMFLNGPRRIALGARLAECGGLAGWRAALEAAARAEFLKGRDGAFHRWFSFDWLLQPDKFTRLMEGRYAERHRHDETDAAAAGGLGATLAALGRAGSGR